MIELNFKQEGKMHVSKETIKAIYPIDKYSFKVWISCFKHNPCVVFGDSKELIKLL